MQAERRPYDKSPIYVGLGEPFTLDSQPADLYFPNSRTNFSESFEHNLFIRTPLIPDSPGGGACLNNQEAEIR